MKAMILKRFGRAENVALETIPESIPGKGVVVLEVKAIGIVPIDLTPAKREGRANR